MLKKLFSFILFGFAAGDFTIRQSAGGGTLTFQQAASASGSVVGSTGSIGITIDGGGSAIVAGSTRSVTVPDNTKVDFAVDCSGTTGWVNVDTFSTNTTSETKNFQRWADGQPVVYGDNSAGGGSSLHMTPYIQ